ncbi:uncharacterized protein BO97DRAFT_460918 [Aspergillus homomorphus CBS 101889]|uniref:Uncharacterized protein n=1 Tax=Aspergillus homomorphus (strain CBS 101889) TaxID=1450537 RepID=A0A395I5A4_ASPHC|nr:hypothetical protein BO97DRAFT_460918 [Aspergillus homomorphus CBS 101889]RAL15381.1 hypothetical protein BO97DRAFT_460918 [Aspergillus homomorphus CBS 101889]
MFRYLALYEAQLKALLSSYGISLPRIYSYLKQPHARETICAFAARDDRAHDGQAQPAPGWDRFIWQHCANKGQAFVRMFSLAPGELQAFLDITFPYKFIRAISPWTDPRALDTWNWVQDNDATAIYDNGAFSDIFTDILGANISDNVLIRMANDLPQFVNGGIGAFFSNLYNTKHGIIIADNLVSPESISKTTHISPLIPLRHWSDVTFLVWKRLTAQAGVAVNSIRHIFHSTISNSDTRDIIKQVLARTGRPLGVWDRPVTFAMDSEEGRAILGTPNGSTVGFFLAQHKEELGRRRKVISVTLFAEFVHGYEGVILAQNESLYFTLNAPEGG